VCGFAYRRLRGTTKKKVGWASPDFPRTGRFSRPGGKTKRERKMIAVYYLGMLFPWKIEIPGRPQRNLRTGSLRVHQGVEKKDGKGHLQETCRFYATEDPRSSGRHEDARNKRGEFSHRVPTPKVKLIRHIPLIKLGGADRTLNPCLRLRNMPKDRLAAFSCVRPVRKEKKSRRHTDFHAEEKVRVPPSLFTCLRRDKEKREKSNGGREARAIYGTEGGEKFRCVLPPGMTRCVEHGEKRGRNLSCESMFPAFNPEGRLVGKGNLPSSKTQRKIRELIHSHRRKEP